MKLVLSSDTSKLIQLPVTLQPLSQRERLRHAGKRFLIFLGLAVAALPLPVAHMILVPTFLFLAFFTSFKSFGVQYRVSLPENSLCPSCQKPLPQNHLLTDQLRLKCPECFAHLVVRTD